MKRSIEILRQHSPQPPLNPDMPEGQHILSVLEGYGAIEELSGEIRRLREQAGDNLLEGHQVRARANVRSELRGMVSGSAFEEHITTTGSNLKAALDDLGQSMTRKKNS